MADKVITIKVHTEAQTKTLTQLQTQLDSLRRKRTALNQAVKKGTITQAQASRQRAQLNLQIKATSTQLTALNKKILVNNGLMKKSSGFTQGITKGMAGFATQMFGVTAAIGLVGAGLRDAGKTIIEFDESVANLQKVTGLAKDEARALAKEVLKIDTRTGVKELLELATAAGRLGLEGRAIVEFTEATDKAFVALSDSVEGTAEEIGLTLGKLAANFDLEEKFGIGEAINKVGSSLNELGANSKAQEGAIIDFTKRLSGVASQAQISLPDIQALGALFDETGQSIEVASTTFNKLLPAIGENVEEFAKVAGVNVEEFEKLIREDAFEALKLVAKGAQSNEEGLAGLSETLQNYGIDSARAASIVGVLSNNTDRLTELQKLSNDAFNEGTSLSDEFNIKNNTARATIERMGNSYDKFILSIEDGSGDISKATSELADMGKTVLDLVTAFNEGTDSTAIFANFALNQMERLGFVTKEQANDAREALTERKKLLDSTKLSEEQLTEAAEALADATGISQGEANEKLVKILSIHKERLDLIKARQDKVKDSTEDLTEATDDNTESVKRNTQAKQENLDLEIGNIEPLDELKFESFERENEVMDAQDERRKAQLDAQLESLDKQALKEIDTQKRRQQAIAQTDQISQALTQATSNLFEVAKNKELALAEGNEKKQEEIIKKFARKQKAVAISQAAIRGGLAILRIASDVPKADFGVTTAILIAAQAALTATTIAAIASQKFADGGRMPGVYDKKDNIPVLLSGDETILTPNQRENLGGAAAMRAAGVPGYFSGGAITPVPKFQAGGRVPEAVTIGFDDFAEQIIEGINNKEVVNVATNTTDQAAEVINIQNNAAFG